LLTRWTSQSAAEQGCKAGLDLDRPGQSERLTPCPENQQSKLTPSHSNRLKSSSQRRPSSAHDGGIRLNTNSQDKPKRFSVDNPVLGSLIQLSMEKDAGLKSRLASYTYTSQSPNNSGKLHRLSGTPRGLSRQQVSGSSPTGGICPSASAAGLQSSTSCLEDLDVLRRI
jgi:hypothetical protein